MKPDIRSGRRLAAPLAILVLVAAVLPAAAQQRPTNPVSGRTPVEREVMASRPAWEFSFGAGVLSGGDLFQVRSEAVRSWDPPAGAPFNSDKYTVTLDEDLLLAMTLAYVPRPTWKLRLDLAWSEVQASAMARFGETVVVVPYDEVSFTSIGVGVEGVMADAGRFRPYLLAQALLVFVGSSGGDLDGVRPGARFGLGLQAIVGPNWSFRAELSDTVLQVDSDDHRDALEEPFEFTEYGPQHLLGATGSVSVSF